MLVGLIGCITTWDGPKIHHSLNHPTSAREQVLFEASKCTALQVSFNTAQAPAHCLTSCLTI